MDKEGSFTGDGLWVAYNMAGMLSDVQKAYGTPLAEIGVGGYTPQEINDMYERQDKVPTGVFTGDQLYHVKKAIDAYRRDNGLPPRLERVQVQTERKAKRMIEIKKLMLLGVSPESIADRVELDVKTVRRAINIIKKETV